MKLIDHFIKNYLQAVPFEVNPNMTGSVTDIENAIKQGKPVPGDAAFADCSVIAGFAVRLREVEEAVSAQTASKLYGH